jgi:hypothetical protein
MPSSIKPSRLVLPQADGEVVVTAERSETIQHFGNFIIKYAQANGGSASEMNIQFETSNTYGKPYRFNFPPSLTEVEIYVGSTKVYPV